MLEVLSYLHYNVIDISTGMTNSRKLYVSSHTGTGVIRYACKVAEV